MTGRIGIDDVVPAIEGGQYPAKAVVGETFPVSATVWRDGHDAVAATLAVRGPGFTRSVRIPMAPGPLPDTYAAAFTPTMPGTWTYRVEGWSDPITTWRSAVEAKLAAPQYTVEIAVIAAR